MFPSITSSLHVATVGLVLLHVITVVLVLLHVITVVLVLSSCLDFQKRCGLLLYFPIHFTIFVWFAGALMKFSGG